MTLKSMAMLEWVQTYCQSAKFLLKADDDVFVNVRVLSEFVRLVENATYVIFGQEVDDHAPIRQGHACKDNPELTISAVETQAPNLATRC